MDGAINKESHARSIIKAFTWRMLGTIDTILLSWLFTGKIIVALSIGGAELFTKVALYYLHERAWQLLPRGTVRKWFNIRFRRATAPSVEL